MAPDQYGDSGRVEQLRNELTQPTIRVVLALVVLLVIRTLLVNVPGTESLILDPDITVATVLYSLLTLMIFGAILTYASAVGAALNRVFREIPDIERVVQLIGALIIIVWAYQLFGWVPYFRDNPTQYDYVFLILGVGFGGWLGYTLYTNIDEYSAYVSPASGSGKDVQNQDDTATMADTEQTTASNSESGETTTLACQDCGAEAPRDADFCSSCGANLTDQRDQFNNILDQS
jgi:hypothetical protein